MKNKIFKITSIKYTESDGRPWSICQVCGYPKILRNPNCILCRRN